MYSRVEQAEGEGFRPILKIKNEGRLDLGAYATGKRNEELCRERTARAPESAPHYGRSVAGPPPLAGAGARSPVRPPPPPSPPPAPPPGYLAGDVKT